MKLIISLLLITLFIICLSQSNSSKTLTSPVKHTITLSGAFGELRTGHFHSGLDIRSSRGSIGDSIFSIADGYISRIKVEPGGYGNSIYITHDNGLKSVYAHLHTFRSDIQDLSAEIQTQSVNFIVDHFLKKDQIKVDQSDFIGIMGNSGNSFGPHLHFEIRDQDSDQLLNPALFGIKPKDTRPPTIQDLSVYQSDSTDQLVFFKQYELHRIAPGVFSMPHDTIDLSEVHQTAISFKAFDRMNGSWNKNGIYRYRIFENNVLVTDVLFDELRFKDSDYIQFIADQFQLQNQESNFHQVSILSDSLSIVKDHDSVISAIPLVSYRIVVEDIEGNQSEISFVVRLQKTSDLPIYHVKDQYMIKADTTTLVQEGKFLAHFQKATLPNDRLLHIDIMQAADKEYVSITPDYIPLAHSFSLHYHHAQIDSALWPKMHFAKCNTKGESINLGGSLTDHWISVELSSFGSYSVEIDTIHPTIKMEQEGAIFSKDQSISFIIKDNNKPSTKKQYLQYQFYIDEEPMVLAYDLKNDRLYGHPFRNLTRGKHDLKLFVQDCHNNESTYSKQISTY